MNFLQGCQRLRQECGGSGLGPASVTSATGESKQFVDWYNQAYLEILEDRRDWNFLWRQASLPLEVGISVYALDSDQPEKGSFSIDSCSLEYVPYREFRALFSSLSSGRPSIFSLRPDGQLALNALPDKPYSLIYEYYLSPVPLVSNVDIPLLPERYHMLIVYKAMQHYAAYENAGEVMQHARTQYEQMLMRLERDCLPEMSFAGPLA